MIRRRPGGVSLLEAVVAIVLMAMTAWSLQTLYVHLLKATKMSQARRAALIEADTLFRQWQRKAKDFWPDDASPIVVEARQGEFLYRVECSGLVPNPFYEGDAAVQSEYLNMQTLTLELTYTEKTQVSDTRHKVRITGSVGR